MPLRKRLSPPRNVRLARRPCFSRGLSPPPPPFVSSEGTLLGNAEDDADDGVDVDVDRGDKKKIAEEGEGDFSFPRKRRGC